MPGGRSKRKNARGVTAAKPPSALLLLDVVDDLGHVVLVLAEFGGVFDQLFVLFRFLQRSPLLLFLVRTLELFRFKIGIQLLGAHGLELLLDRRGGARAPRAQERLGIEGRRTFRADDRVAQQIVVARAAARADALGSPFGFRHGGSSIKIGCCKGGGALATGISRCQKQNARGASGSGIWAAAPVPARSPSPSTPPRRASRLRCPTIT